MSEASPTASFVIVANRLPVDRVPGPDGEEIWRRSPGGLVAALEPVMHAVDGAWVGWAGQADLDLAPFTEDGMLGEGIEQHRADRRFGVAIGFGNRGQVSLDGDRKILRGVARSDDGRRCIGRALGDLQGTIKEAAIGPHDQNSFSSCPLAR